MAVIDVIVGYVRGLKGDTGATGATGATGPGATINVGTVTTTTYGNPAQVTNSGTETNSVLNFVIPQGAPGEEVTDVSSLTLDSVTSTAASFPIPAVGEVMSVIMGKIIKFFGDTVTALNTKLNRSDVTTSLGVTTTGQALDATAGKTLNDSISALNDSLTIVKTKDKMFGFVDVQKTNVIVSGDGAWTNLGNVNTDFGVPTSAYILAYYVRGWSGTPGVFTLISSSNGSEIYLHGTKAGTYQIVSFRIWYINFNYSD